MVKKMFFVLFINILLLINFGYSKDIDLQERTKKLEMAKKAFMKGFFSQKIKGIEIYKEMLNKYGQKPLLLIQLVDTYRDLSEPIIAIKYKTKVDALGRLIIYPNVKITDIQEDDFPNIFYLSSLIKYKKDFKDFEKLEQKIDKIYKPTSRSIKELNINNTNNNSIKVFKIQ